VIRSNMKFFFALIYLISIPVSSYGQIDDSVSVSNLTPESGWDVSQNFGEISLFTVLGKGIGALLLIMLMIYGVVWLLRYLMNKKNIGSIAASSIRVISTTYIAPKKSVTLLQVYDKAVLIGITENSMDALIELEEDAGWKELISEAQETVHSESSFAQKLSKALKENISKGFSNKGNNS